jgi:uncharacterized protein
MKIVTELPKAIQEIENLWIELKDGTRLAARMWLPEDAAAKPVPAILEYIPYRKRDFTTARDEPMHRYFAGHGYAAIRVDMRGSGDSDGVMADEYTARELDDGVAVIDWISRQAWCSGSVGMMGNSWGGFNALQVAALRPPALKAIITSCSTDDRYADDMHYMGGCLLNDNMDWGTTFFAILPRAPDPAVVGERWRSMWRDRLEAMALPLENFLLHQRRDSYWRHGSVCEDYGRIDCAVFAVGGWLDGYSNAIPRLLANLSCPRLGLIGPWAHMYPHLGLPGPAVPFLQEALRWWDHWLKGVETGIMREPVLRAYMSEGIPARSYYEQAPGRWVAEEVWPSPRISARFLHLRDGRLTDSAGPGAPTSFKSPETTGLTGGEWCPFGTVGRGPDFPGDQREDDGRSLTFDSALLDERLEILGAPVLQLRLSADCPTAFIAARLCDVAPDGASTRVSFGVLNLTHREGHDRVLPLEESEIFDVRVQFNDAGYSFLPGHRIRIALSTSYWPMIWPAPKTPTLTLHDSGRLELPVRPPRATDAAAGFGAQPECAANLPRTVLRNAGSRRRIERDRMTDRVTASGRHDWGLTRLDSHGLEFGGMMREESSIRDGDPLSAETRTSFTITIGRADWQTRIEAATKLTSNRNSFLLTARMEAFEGETKVFTRRWRRRIPRDGI